MKRKILFFVLIATVLTALFFTLGVCYAAEETDAPQNPANENPASEEVAAEEEDGAQESAEENVFALLFERIKEYSAQILSALTLIGSLLLAHAYKRGLFPLLEKGLNALSNTAKGIKEKSDETKLLTDEMKESLGNRMENVEALLEGFSKELNTLSSDLDRAMRDVAERKAHGIVLNEQIELLYDIFMSSTLPQYRKDEVGERVGKMKEALRENENRTTDEEASA